MLYVVAMTLNPGVGMKRVQDAMNLAHSWYRFGVSSWVLCTHESAATWSNRLSQFARPSGTMFIARLDPQEYQGWMTEEFWQWLRLHSNEPF
jgi:hypothetical protein